jgi:hypothetical protein
LNHFKPFREVALTNILSSSMRMAFIQVSFSSHYLLSVERLSMNKKF